MHSVIQGHYRYRAGSESSRTLMKLAQALRCTPCCNNSFQAICGRQFACAWQTCSPAGVPEPAGLLTFSTIFSHCVPLPAAGAPLIITLRWPTADGTCSEASDRG